MNESRLLANEVAVITGASSGIGRAIALEFANQGADVVVADIREDPREGGPPTHQLIEQEMDRHARFIECDVTNLDQLEEAMAAADDLGGIDVMVNNAGVVRGEEFFEVSEDDFDWTMNVNVKGTFFGSQVAARRMVDAGGGSIVNLSSVAGIRGGGAYVTYCTSKGAVRLMTYALASRLGPEGIRVNAIHPGVIETAMTMEDIPIVGTEAGDAYLQQIPSRRFGQPENVAEVAVFLASELANYVNGESVIVDGGMTNTL